MAKGKNMFLRKLLGSFFATACVTHGYCATGLTAETHTFDVKIQATDRRPRESGPDVVNQNRNSVASNVPSLVGRKCSFPAKIDTAQKFFDAMLGDSGLHVIAKDDLSIAQLNKLNGALANKSEDASKALEVYLDITNSSAYEARSLLLILSTSSTQTVLPNGKRASEASGLSFVNSLSAEQVDLMYLNGKLTPNALQPDQQLLMADFVRTSRIFDEGDFKPSTWANEKILNLPFKFLSTHSASVKLRFANGEETQWVGVYNYGRGPIGKDIALPARSSMASPNNSPEVQKASAAEALSRTRERALVSIPDTRSFQFGHIISLVAKPEEFRVKEIYLDPDLATRSLVVSRGKYGLKELRNAITLVTGAELRKVQDLVFIGPRNRLAQTLMLTNEYLDGAAEQACSILDRHRIEEDLPFDSGMFKSGAAFSLDELAPDQQDYLRRRLLSADPKIFNASNLPGTKLIFGDTVWFQASYDNGILNLYDYQIH